MSGHMEYLSYENGEYLTKAQFITICIVTFQNLSSSADGKRNMVTNHMQKLVKQSVKMF